MELLLNDLSFHEQFQNVAEFRGAIGRVVRMRNAARVYCRELQCHRNIVNKKINSSTSVYEAIQTFTRDEKRAILPWLTQRGPFWEEMPSHDPNDWLESAGEIVTETAVGEVAYCAATGIDRRLVSLAPSSWEHTPISVTVLGDSPIVVQVNNYWAVTELEAALSEAELPITSWSQLESVSISRYQQLRFWEEAFRPLRGLSFSPTAAEYIKSRLHVLNEVMRFRDKLGKFTPAAKPILDAHLTRGSDHFSDSSTEEKRNFRDKLSFPHPDIPGETLDCTWHAKVKPLLIRLHFRWPVPPGEPLYIVYVGRKITADN